MSQFEETYKTVFEFCVWTENKDAVEAIEKLRFAHDEDMKYQHELLKKHIEASVSIINTLQSEIIRLKIKCKD